MIIKGRYISLTKLISWSFGQLFIVAFIFGPFIITGRYLYQWWFS